MSAGRPTKYEAKFNKQAERLCKLGATDVEISDFFECDVATLNRWKKKYPRFCASIKRGKIEADANVADSLFKRAMGYSHPDVDIKVINNKIEMTKLTRHYPPDTAAGIFWLKNRQKKKWRDKIEQGFTDEDGNDINPVHIFKLPDNERGLETKSDSGN